MTSPLYVDTIHLNVGIGDCSIVCKLRKGTNPKDKPILVSAVIIDGGLQGAAGVIETCLTLQIPKLYDLSGMGGTVKLQAVVITHWDRDHWGGLMNLIRDDLTTKSKGKTGKEVEGLRSTYFIYSGLASGELPFTTMYLPYWDQGTTIRSSRLNRLDKSDRYESICGDVLDFDLTAEGRKRKWVRSLCRLRSSSTQNIGQNFFTGTGPPSTTDMSTPGKLAAALINGTSPGLASGEPALVCVACDGVGVWNTGSSSSGSKSKAVMVNHSDSVGKS
jgi:hypothetical protein